MNAPADIQPLLTAALAAADPAKAVARHLHRQAQQLVVDGQRYDVKNGRLFLISVGKASLPMAQAAAAILGDLLTAGIVITKKGAEQATSHQPQLTTFLAAHPVADQSSITATTAVRHLLHQTTANDLVLCLISGGTSALLTQPQLPLPNWQALNQALLASGCTINEFNTVRRQLDAVKGGGLAQWAAPATCVSLILSDVVGSPLADIGSGPTIPTAETAVVAQDILTRYKIGQQVDVPTWETVQDALRQTASPNPPAGQAVIVSDVRAAAEAAVAAAQQQGLTSQLLTVHLEGEAREMGQLAAALARDCPPNHCYVLGGETTVTLRGDGIGGRNLETALAAAIGLAGWDNRLVAAFATDGDDGPTQAAGAMVTGDTVANGRLHQLDAAKHLQNNDSYSYFAALDQHLPTPHLITTGLTGTNVNDLIIILHKPMSKEKGTSNEQPPISNAQERA